MRTPRAVLDNGPEQMARRTLFTGEDIILWSDGSISRPFGFYVEGSPRPRTNQGKEIAVDAGWLVIGDCEIYDLDELPMLIEAAMWTVRRDRLPGTMRRRFAELKKRRGWPQPEWTSIQEDACGRVVVRCWMPHRLSAWGGFGVIDDTRAVGGRSTLARITPGTSTLEPAGLQFGRLADLLNFMADTSNQPQRG